MEYDSKTYWSERANPNRKDATPNDVELNLVGGVTGNVLDFGCGIGRTFPLYVNASDVIGVDFVETYRTRAMENAAQLPCDFHHMVYDVHEHDLPYGPDTFETGVLCAVLLHAPHWEAKRIIMEMGRVCKKVCVVSYMHDGQKLANHVFAHDYQQMIKDTGHRITTMDENYQLKQIYFEYEKNR